MKPWIILLVLAVAITTIATVVVPYLSPDSSVIDPSFPAPVASDGPAPSVVIDGEMTHKFTLMAQDTEGKFSWTFRNNGPGVLELRSLGTDCSCTIANLGKPSTGPGTGSAALTVPPKASEPIELVWNTRKTDGPYRKTARIGTNDPNRPEITLVIEGVVRPAVTMLPPDTSVNFQTVSNDEPVVRKIALFSGDRPDIQVTRVVSSNPTLIGVEARPMTPEEAKSIKSAKGQVIEVTLKMTPNLGSFAEEILITTDHPLRPEIRMPVLGRVTGPITVSPEKVFLRNVASRTGASEDLTMWVRGRSSATFEVEKKPQGVDVAIEPMPQAPGTKGSKFKMTVKVIPGTPAGPISDEIVLKTDHPQAGQIKVPVDVLVQGTN